MNFVADYLLKETDQKVCGFVGMNTGKGFAGKYNDIIDENSLKRLYIIKGAAGTGKSTVMRQVAEMAEKNGCSVSRYLCSSDPDSLDCIVIDGKISVLDGTSPHALEMRYPGAVSEIVDLSVFWDTDELVKKRSDIISLTNNKKTAFSDAYSLLAEASSLAVGRYNYSVRTLMLDKLDRYTTRFVGGLGKGNGRGIRQDRITRAVGMKGSCRIGCLEAESDRIVFVEDVYGTAYHLMDVLAGKLTRSGFDIVVSPDPVTPSLISDVYIPQIRTLLTVSQPSVADKSINMARFVDKDSLSEIRGFMRLSLKCSDSLLSAATERFSYGGKAHYGLEKIYSSSMDFDALNKFTEKLQDRIFDIL